MSLPRTLLRAQDRLASLLGCEPEARSAVIADMLHRSPREVTGYWLQLVVATGIATLGLALGSTAVVIGAMLVAPLMGPIVGLGMGLAIGSPLLVVRGAGRVALSVALVIALSAVITRLLPFHELNPELAARTKPTALDLGTAMFCAIAGVYAALRPSSDVATTAAGTSIGISLVPPLCASGFGVGTSMFHVAKGAGLLFLTNFVAIVLVGTLAFALAGFGQVELAELETRERDTVKKATISIAVATVLARLFRSPGGPWLRILMPVALLAALFSPLRQGLDEVAWQIRARGAIDTAVSAVPGRVLQSRVRVERHQIELVIFLLGGQGDADAARETLRSKIAGDTGVSPRIEVFAVTDAAEFETLERTLVSPPTPVPEPPPPAPAPSIERVATALELATARVRSAWPRKAAGSLLLTEVSLAEDRLELHVIHFGARLEDSAREALGRVVSDELGVEATLTADAIPVDEIDLQSSGPAGLARVASALGPARRVSSIQACVTLARAPAPTSKSKSDPAEAAARDALSALTAGEPRVSVTEGDRTTVRFVEGPCEAGD